METNETGGHGDTDSSQCHSKVTIQYKRTLNDIERTKSEMAEEENKFYKQDKEYELELLYIDLQVWDNKMRQSKKR
ncbi:MAG: hypothetical protein CM15mV11_2980 [Caudoviricetes sp.]|nr:MAG: hypothetical protein CM15mV11_2980 [Caudoviricetes sp.]